MTELEKIKQHLSKSDLNYIDVYETEPFKKLDTKVFHSNIEKTVGTVANYITSLVQDKAKELSIFLRKKRGTSSTLQGTLNIAAGLESETEATNSNNNIKKTQQQTAINFPQQALNMPQVEHQAHQVHQAVPVSSESALYANLKERHVDLRERYVEVKEDKKELKRKLRKVKEELDEANLKVKYAEKEKQYALQDAERSRQGFFDTETGQLVVASLTGVAEDVIKTKTASQTAGLNNAAQEKKYAPNKQALIDHLKSDSVSEDVCRKLLYTAIGITDKGEQFNNQLLELLANYQLKDN